MPVLPGSEGTDRPYRSGKNGMVGGTQEDRRGRDGTDRRNTRYCLAHSARLRQIGLSIANQLQGNSSSQRDPRPIGG